MAYARPVLILLLALALAGPATLPSAVPAALADPGTVDPGTVDPGTVDPGTVDPGTAAAEPGGRTARETGTASASDHAIRFRRGDAGPEIEVPTPGPAAAFLRAGHLWIVVSTDRDLVLPARAAGERTGRAADAELMRLEGAVVLRMRAEAGWRVTAERREGGWRFAVAGPGAPDAAPDVAAPDIATPRSTLGSSRTVIGIPGRVGIHEVVDPVVGTALLVVTVLEPGVAMPEGRRFVPYRLLPTSLGLAVEPLADGVAVQRRAGGIVLQWDRPGERRGDRPGDPGGNSVRKPAE